MCLFPIFISSTPTVIQINSRNLVIIPVYIPKAAGIDNPATANTNPPSRAPNCMGEKKKIFEKSEVKAIIKIQLAKLASLVMTCKIK